MAKPAKETAVAEKAEEKAQVPATQTDLLAFMTDEEKAEMLTLTGQEANLRGEKIPTIKVNYSDTPDVNGNTIKKGNFVYGQSSKTVEVDVVDEDGDAAIEERMEDLGVDLGRIANITVLAYRQQYAFYSEDAKQRCNSQIFGTGETPVGSTLKHECRGGTCPRRKADVDKKEKCTCQYVVLCMVNVDGEEKPAMMYVKGSSFMPFSDYLKSAGQFPLPYASTKMKTKQEKQGSVTYFTVTFELDTANPYAPEIRERNKGLAKDAISGLETFKAQQSQKKASRQIVDKSAGAGAVDVTQVSDDEIIFE